MRWCLPHRQAVGGLAVHLMGLMRSKSCVVLVHDRALCVCTGEDGIPCQPEEGIGEVRAGDLPSHTSEMPQ